MQRLTRRVVFFGALAVWWACSGDPTNNQGTPTAIVTNPEVVFVAQGDSAPVIVSVVDEDGQALEATFTAPTSVGTGIAVTLDPNFLPVVSSDPARRSARYFVKGIDLTASQFTIEALGLTKTVQVTSIPANLAATLSTTTPALGDTVTLTAPPGIVFSDSTGLTIGGGAPDIVSQDATTFVFVPGPNIADLPAVLTNVGVTSNPKVVFALTTTQTIKTDSIANIGAGLSTNTPALGAPVTLTLPAGIRVVPESAQGLTIAAATVAPINIVVAGDSGSITFVPPPNADSFVVVPGVIAQRLPQYPLLLSTTAKVTTPVVTTVPSTLSSTNPGGGVAVTLTSTNGSFTFGSTSRVAVGADSAFTTSIAAGGGSITFVPKPGSTGAVSVSGVIVAGFSLGLPSTAPALTAGTTVTPIAGTGSTSTAPTIPIPAAGISRGFVDAVPAGYAPCAAIFGGNCQIYKFTLAAERVFDVAAEWEGASDVGIYFFASDGTTLAGTSDCDAGGPGVFEACTQDLTAGTYFLAVVPFAAPPAWVTVNITGE